MSDASQHPRVNPFKKGYGSAKVRSFVDLAVERLRANQALN